MDRDKILLTPGPLTTTLRTKLAMLRDWGSWDADFNAVTARVRQSLLKIVHGEGSHVVVPLQGSGTFSVEAAVATVVPRDGHVLVLDNGAYCKRAAKLTSLMGRRCTVQETPDHEPVSAARLEAQLDADPSITHVVLIHCETGAGVLNPLQQVADSCAARGKGLIVDAMSSFGALPICTPALLDIARYFFINAMTTISAVVFLYSPETKVASIAILNLDEAGEMGAAAAMAVLIGIVSTFATLLFMALAWWINRRTQAWRQPALR